MAKKKKRVFVSFDYDNDRDLKILLVGQSQNPNSPFEVIDSSLKEAAPEKDWVKKARAKIKGSDVVIVIVGRSTYKAPGVKKEIKIAQEERIPRFQIKGRENVKLTPVEGGGRYYDWTWPNLKKLLS